MIMSTCLSKAYRRLARWTLCPAWAIFPVVAAPAPTPAFFDGVDEASRPVMAAARQRIEEVRMGDLAPTFVDDQGRSINAPARVRLVSHAFAFGAHFGGVSQPDRPLNQAVLDVVDELCNCVVVTGYWKAVEPRRGQLNWKESDALLQWAQDHGKSVRFHCIIYSFPEWVKTLDSQEAWWEVFEARIKSVGERFGKTIQEYDVINEMVTERGVGRGKAAVDSYRNYPDVCKPETDKRLLELARKYLPEAKLVVLEARIAVPNSPEFKAIYAYYQQLLAINAPFDYVGHQGHFYQGGTTPISVGHPRAGPGAFTMKQLDAGLDMLASLGKPVVITEFNPPSRDGNTAKGRAQSGLTPDELAAWTVNYFTLVYSKPYTLGLSRWFVADGARGMDAGLLTEDGQKKPVYFALKKLLKETWHTDWRGSIKDGAAAFRGFYGTYETTVDGYAPTRFSCAAAAERSPRVVLKSR